MPAFRGNTCGDDALSTGHHNRVSTSRVVIPAVFWPESTEKLDAGLKIAGMTSGEMDISFCGGVLRNRITSFCGRVLIEACHAGFLIHGQASLGPWHPLSLRHRQGPKGGAEQALEEQRLVPGAAAGVSDQREISRCFNQSSASSERKRRDGPVRARQRDRCAFPR